MNPRRLAEHALDGGSVAVRCRQRACMLSLVMNFTGDGTAVNSTSSVPCAVASGEERCKQHT